MERFFNVNIGLIKIFGTRLLAHNSNRRDRIVKFERKPQDWSRVAFFAEAKNNYYVRMSREEIYPLLSLKDSIIPMKLDVIFPNVKILTSAEFAEQERKLGKIIRIYHQNEEGKIKCPETRVYGSFFHNDRPMLHLLINDKKLIFTEQAKFRLKVAKLSVV